MSVKYTKIFLFTAVFLLGSIWMENARAAEPDLVIRDGVGFAAAYVSQSLADPISLKVGETKVVVFKFKNIGTQTWQGDGQRFLSAYTMEPKYRSSIFADQTWLSSNQTAKISGSVKPGEIGELALSLRAPQTPGEYVERFYLAAENYSWVRGGYFYVKIKVEPGPVSTAVADDLSAKLVVINKSKVEAAGGQLVKLIATFKNLGTTVWKDYSWEAETTATVGEFADDSWADSQTILTGQANVEKDRTLRLEFFIRTPAKQGNYSTSFFLSVAGEKVPGAILVIPVIVTQNAPTGYQASQFSVSSESEVLPPLLTEEPRVRVGIEVGETVSFMSLVDDYQVFRGEHDQGVLRIGETAKMDFIDGQYHFKSPSLEFSTHYYIRLVPQNNPHAIFVLPDFERRVSWLNNLNFNQYRGSFEYRRGEVDQKLYMVNDLLLEDYVAGIAETSRSAPIEFVKANLVAARNYAYVAKGKYPFFDLVATTYDQLYLGQVVAEILPNVVEAAAAVRGMFVTYENQIVVTPYFGRSNGWTKSWSKVWGGQDRAWLKPVRTGYDAGYSQLGHGVGLSQHDAALRAEKEGLSFEDLLQYYYSGTKVRRGYE